MSPATPSSSADCGEFGLCGVVLVGGRSSRMGRDKASLPHPAGGTFLEYAIHRLLALRCPIIVSGTQTLPPRFQSEPSVTALADPPLAGERIPAGSPANAGPVVGLVAALEQAAAAGATGILATPVDMPCLTSGDLQAMQAAFAELCGIGTQAGKATPGGRQPLIGTFDGQHREPLVAIYPLEMLPPLQQLAAGRDRSLTRWLATQPHRLHALSAEAAPNVNTPIEYEQVLHPSTPPAPSKPPAPKRRS